MIKIYQPWPAPVRAACYDGRAALTEIEAWVGRLRARGHVGGEIGFSVHERAGTAVGVLSDATGEHELRPSGYLVFGCGGLQVLDSRSFHRLYHDPDQPYAR